MGLLSTLGLLQRTEPITVVGPVGIDAFVQAMPGLGRDRLPYPIEFVEVAEDLTEQTVWETDEVVVTARPVEHRIFAMGFRFEEKPRPGHLYPEEAKALGVTDYAHFRALKRGEAVTLEDGTVVQPEQVVGPERPGVAFAYAGDTRPCAATVALARDADLLYHEATFGDELDDRAAETGHSTAREAATIAAEAGVARLLLGHFSARYTNVAPLVAQAREVFQNTEAARELKRYVLGG
jgi:ribonuclease Z